MTARPRRSPGAHRIVPTPPAPGSPPVAPRGDDALLRALFHHTPDGVLLSRPDGNVVRANSAACQMLGRSEAEIIALGRHGLVPDSQLLRQMLSERAHEGTAAGELSLLRGDGALLPVELTSALFTGEDGAPYTCTIFRDISDRRAAAEAIRERDYLLSESQRIAQIGTWDLTLPDGPLEWSDEMYRLFGVEPHFELSPASFLTLISGDDHALAATWIRACASGENPGLLDFRVTLSDGRVRHLQARGELRPDDGASSRRMTGTVQDITEQRRVEEALRQSVERFELASRATFDAIWDLHLPTNVLSFNDNFTALLGYTRTSPPNQEDCTHPDDRRRVKDGFAAALASNRHTWMDEYRLMRSDGTAAMVRNRAYIVRDAAGHAVRVVGALEDVTEQRREQSERDRLIRAIEQAAEMVVITDASGTIEYVNPAFERVTGYARAEARGKNPRILQSGQHGRDFYRTLWTTLHEGRTWSGRFMNRRKSGEVYTEDASISPVRDRAGEVAGYVAVKRDITRELETEARLEQSYRLEGIGRLAGGVAHDFNNLLTVILGHTEVLLSAPLDDSHEALLEIQHAAERAATLTRQLLAFGRRQALVPAAVDLNIVIGGLEAMLRRLIREDVHLMVELPSCPIVVDGDAGQLEQVLLNLVLNARDAITGSGRITVTAAVAAVDAQSAAAHADITPGAYAVVEVTDTGIGMDHATARRVFEPFFTTKPPGRGTGLGLATVYGIVRQTGGTIVVHSEPGLGSSFKVYLPLSAEAAADEAARVTSAVEGGSETVLVVEDDEAVRQLTARLLRTAGYCVLTAACGREALELLEQEGHAVRLVITDLVMPEMGGRELAARLRQGHPGIKALLMSGYAHEELELEHPSDESLRFVSKPLTRASLLHGVRATLDGHAPQ